MTRVGFAGVGLMGHGMAKNIVEKGFPLSVLGHTKREAVEDLVKRGATEVTSPKALAEASDVIITTLPASPQVEAFVAAACEADVAGKTFVDCSTANPVSTRALAARLAERGAKMIDAPLSRTPKEAWEGTLDVMVGATEDDFAGVAPVLNTFGGRVIRVGELGAGHTMKLLNNFLSMGYAAIYSEALAIGAKNGIDAQTFHSIVGGGRMDCGFYQTFMSYVVGGDPNAHRFAIRNGHKDVRYLVGLANESGIASQVSSAVKNTFALAEAAGRGDHYVPTLADFVAELNGIGKAS